MTDAMSFFDAQPHIVGGADPSFESFIDSDLILDTSSPAPTPSTPMSKKDVKAKPSSLSALPPRLSLPSNGTLPGSPGPISEFLSYSQSTTSSVTTPTTSNSSSLHNLNFDFFDDGETDTHSVNQSVSDSLTSPQADPTSARQHSLTPTALNTMTTATAPLYQNGQDAAPAVMQFASPLGPAVQPFLRSVDDMGHQLGHQLQHHPAHHQRSLSLREVAPSLSSLQPAFYPAGASTASSPFTFASAIKMEPGQISGNAHFDQSNHLSSVPAAAVQDDETSAPQGKKRRISGKAKGEGGKANAGRGSAGSARKNGAGGRRKSGGKIEKDESEQSPSTHGQNIDASSLIENRQLPTPMAERDASVCNDDEQMDDTLEREASGSVSASMFDDDIGDDSMSCEGAQKKGTKRPPPSASQVTEAGMPFPVIDTSAKHSSLFVPPDTSGLTKREARLVKNRAAAFLSRQRKREQFEELEIKCRNLCRLVWKMWQLGNDAASGKKGAHKNSAFADHAKLSGVLQDAEGADVREILDMVLTLKGGSIAPTEDGQLQGAVAAGIKSANGKIVNDAGSAIMAPSSAAQAAEEASRTVSRLRAELDEQRKREAGLQAELANERALRMKMEFDAKQREQEQRPFRNGGLNGNLSLTIPATFDDDEDEDEADNDKVAGASRVDVRATGRANGNGKRSRTSQRLQRQSSSNSLANSGANAPNQRKAASAALMMVLFSFALFGMPGSSKMGQKTMMGGISHAPGSSSNAFPLGRVLTAPVVGGAQPGDEDEEMTNELQSHLPPSSHLSIDDLISSTQEMQDLLRDADSGRDSQDDLHKSIRNALKDHGATGSTSDTSVDFSMDYKAFAKDLSTSLDWDMQGGFLVLGTGEEEETASGQKDDKRTKEEGDEDLIAEKADTPTKLTLFVPAPRERSNSPEMDAIEDRFYDAPLATEGGKQTDATTDLRELSQADATRAALQVLRNHRVAREAAAFAASRHVVAGKASPSARLSSPTRSSSSMLGGDAAKDVRTGKGHGDKVDEDDEEDFSQEMQQSGTKNADQIRGTDFYQLEFSLSGAKVRNVAELTRLFGSMRTKRCE